MITLTTAHPIRTVLGGAATVDYDKVVLVPRVDPEALLITGPVRLSCSLDDEQPDIGGSFTIDVRKSRLEIAIEQLDFYRSVVLTPIQNNAAQAIIDDAQDSVESGLISLGVIDGIQSTGV